MTANDIRSAGYSDIAARSDQTIEITARSNVRAGGFDDIQLLTEFADKKDGTVQQSNISLSSFDGVRVSLTPALLPDGFTIEQK